MQTGKSSEGSKVVYQRREASRRSEPGVGSPLDASRDSSNRLALESHLPDPRLRDFLCRIAFLEFESDGWAARSDTGDCGWAQELGVTPRTVRNRRRALRRNGLIDTRRQRHCVDMRLTERGRQVLSEYLRELQQSGANLARALLLNSAL
jgi:DNA-binding transcriptional ArsR family regulator